MPLASGVGHSSQLERQYTGRLLAFEGFAIDMGCDKIAVRRDAERAADALLQLLEAKTPTRRVRSY